MGGVLGSAGMGGNTPIIGRGARSSLPELAASKKDCKFVSLVI